MTTACFAVVLSLLIRCHATGTEQVFGHGGSGARLSAARLVAHIPLVDGEEVLDLVLAVGRPAHVEHVGVHVASVEQLHVAFVVVKHLSGWKIYLTEGRNFQLGQTV